MEPLHIHLFGGFLLERGGTALPPIASRAGRSLFAYLAMHPGRPLQRDYLAGIFWPDLPEGRARRRLSHTLWQIQDVVNTESASYLDATTDTLAFNESTPYWLDVAVFDQGFSARPEEGSHRGHEVTRLRNCVELYRGDFLAGYFDDWVLVEQDHYRQRYLVALRRLIDATKSNGAYEEALAYARRLTHHDPLSEEAHREVMRLDFLLGRTTEAIEQFERCRSVLEEELGTEPSAPTIEIYEKIMKQRRSGVRPLREEERAVLLGRRADTPFVGRDHERRRLIDSFERVLSGAGGVVLVEGEPGVGKTRTTLEAAEDARWRGFEVSWGSCRPGALRPFAPLIEVLESLSPLRVEQLSEQVSPVWLSEVARLVPNIALRVDTEGSAQLRPAEESTRMIESLVNVMGALGKIAPHLIIVDDVHWADQDTLAVLTQVGQRLAESRVLLMLLYRSEEARGDAAVWDVMRDLDRAAGLSRVVLSPLSVFELEEMVRRVLGTTQLDAEVASRLHRQTGGNVLFTLETLLAMRDRGLFESGADPATVLEQQIQGGGVPLAPRVRSVIESRLSMLSDEVTTVYELAAVADDRVGLPLIEAATAFSRSSVLAAVDELLYRGLLIDDGLGQYRLTHDQVRQVVYDEMDPGVRNRLHLRVAETLADTDPDNVEAIGHHFQESGHPARATDYLERAGLRAIELNAFATARSHLQAAHETASEAGVGDVRRYQLLGHLDDVLGVLGRRDEQRQVIDEMALIAEALPALHGDLERRRAWLLAQTGELQQAETSARRSVAVERSDGDEEGVASSLVALGTIQRWSGRPLEAIPALTEAVELANDPSDRADALTELASTLVEVQQIDEALEHLAEAGEIYRSLNDLRGQAEVAGIEARLLHRHGDKEQAVGRYEEAIELCHRIGYRHGEGVNLTNLANLQQATGAVTDALAGYDRAARIFAELGNRRGEAMVLVNSAWARHALLGEDERAKTDALIAMRHFATIGDLAGQAHCKEIVAGAELRAGRRAEARRLLEESFRDLDGTGTSVLSTQVLRSIALLDIAEGDVSRAMRTLDAADAMSSDSGLQGLAVDLLSIRGMAQLRAGDTERAITTMRKAISRLSPGAERPFLVHHRHALAAEVAGEVEEAQLASLTADRLLRDALDGLEVDDFQRAISRVPEHRDIVTRAERFAPSVIEVELPALGTPTGRPLKGADLRLVRWTVDHPDDQRHFNDIDRRRARLLRILAEAEESGAAPTTEHLANALSVSSSTIRRDLHALRADGHSLRTRGQRRTG
jgi:DNA-binding SARP family transcriptional activator/biotin operon repressor